jgi:hypothetical protein
VWKSAAVLCPVVFGDEDGDPLELMRYRAIPNSRRLALSAARSLEDNIRIVTPDRVGSDLIRAAIVNPSISGMCASSTLTWLGLYAFLLNRCLEDVRQELRRLLRFTHHGTVEEAGVKTSIPTPLWCCHNFLHRTFMRERRASSESFSLTCRPPFKTMMSSTQRRGSDVGWASQ